MVVYDPLLDIYKPFGTLKTAGKGIYNNIISLVNVRISYV